VTTTFARPSKDLQVFAEASYWHGEFLFLQPRDGVCMDHSRQCSQFYKKLFSLTVLVAALTACKESDIEDVSSSAHSRLPSGTAGEALRNQIPRIAGNPKTEAESGSLYSFEPSASDPDGDRLGFSVRNLPDWADFNPSTGAIWGTPADEDIGVNGGIVISVGDGKSGAALPPFSVVILEAGSLPSSAGEAGPAISGAPANAAVVGGLYVFQPLATDEDTDFLTFSIENKPPWLSFDSLSGTLSGIPTAADVGRYSNITIAVSDGGQMASLQPFDIDVVTAGQESVTLAWAPPLANADGSALVDLAGFKIRYGEDPGAFDRIIDIDSPGITTYVVDGLTPGTYFFAISAYNDSGLESDTSNVATATLN